MMMSSVKSPTFFLPMMGLTNSPSVKVNADFCTYS